MPTDVRHLDVAAAGRVSQVAYDAEVTHLREEARRGAYVTEVAADPVVAGARHDLAGLVGLDGSTVAWSDGAATAMLTALAGWPLGRGARVGTIASEYGSNALALRQLADARGWHLRKLPVDDLGRLQDVPAGLDLLTFPMIASQRGVVQPVRDLVATGVPLLLDVAQALGQTQVPAGCAGYVGTSRKWLCGPRGVGFLILSPDVEPHVTGPPLVTAHTDVRRLDAQEGHVAGRVGLAHAVREWTPELLPVIHARAGYARRVLADTPWRVVEPVDEPSGITTLVGGEPVATRAALLDQGLLVNAIPVSRAPDLTEPVLRISTAAWTTTEDLDLLAAALRTRGRALGSFP